MGSFIAGMPVTIGFGLIWGIMAIGVYITFRVLDFADLTVDGTLATGGAAFVVSMTAWNNFFLSLLIAFLAGCIAGFITGILNTLFGIPPILAGILTQLALYSINLRIQQRPNVSISVYMYDLLASQNEITRALIIIGIFVLVIIGALYWFFGTEIGHSIRATGCNMNMARANGININASKIIALVISNGLVALAGGFLAQYQGFADVKMGQGAIVIGLAAVIISEVLFGKIFKNFALKLLGVAIGGIVYYVVMSFALSLGLNTDDLKLLIAVIVALFLGVPYWKSHIDQKRVGKNKKSKGAQGNA